VIKRKKNRQETLKLKMILFSGKQEEAALELQIQGKNKDEPCLAIFCNIFIYIGTLTLKV